MTYSIKLLHSNKSFSSLCETKIGLKNKNSEICYLQAELIIPHSAKYRHAISLARRICLSDNFAVSGPNEAIRFSETLSLGSNSSAPHSLKNDSSGCCRPKKCPISCAKAVGLSTASSRARAIAYFLSMLFAQPGPLVCPAMTASLQN